MAEKNFVWHKIAEHVSELNFLENQIASVEVDGKKICVAKYNEGLYAFAHRCPHAGGHLADATIDGQGNLVCPIHSYRYSLKNGTNTSGEGFHLKHWRIESREDGIFVEMEESGGFWARLSRDA